MLKILCNSVHRDEIRKRFEYFLDIMLKIKPRPVLQQQWFHYCVPLKCFFKVGQKLGVGE